MKAQMGEKSFEFNSHDEFIDGIGEHFVEAFPEGGPMTITSPAGESVTVTVGIPGEGSRAREFNERFLGA